MEDVVGVVGAVRRIGALLFFLELVADGCEASAEIVVCPSKQKARAEAMQLQESSVRELKRILRVGDRVRVTVARKEAGGARRGGGMLLHAARVQILSMHVCANTGKHSARDVTATASVEPRSVFDTETALLLASQRASDSKVHHTGPLSDAGGGNATQSYKFVGTAVEVHLHPDLQPDLQGEHASRAHAGDVTQTSRRACHNRGASGQHESGEASTAAFAAWLLDDTQPFGVSTLVQGAGVLDVAGGRGDLSLALTLAGKLPIKACHLPTTSCTRALLAT